MFIWKPFLKSNQSVRNNSLFKFNAEFIKQNKMKIITDPNYLFVKSFKGIRSKYLNRKLYQNQTLTNQENEYINKLDYIFENYFDRYKGTSYRVLGFNNKIDFDNFVDSFNVGSPVTFKNYSFMSDNREGWKKHALNQPYKAYLEIDSSLGYDLRGTYGSDEIVLPRNTTLRTIETNLYNNRFQVKLEDI